MDKIRVVVDIKKDRYFSTNVEEKKGTPRTHETEKNRKVLRNHFKFNQSLR